MQLFPFNFHADQSYFLLFPFAFFSELFPLGLMSTHADILEKKKYIMLWVIWNKFLGFCLIRLSKIKHGGTIGKVLWRSGEASVTADILCSRWKVRNNTVEMSEQEQTNFPRRGTVCSATCDDA